MPTDNDTQDTRREHHVALRAHAAARLRGSAALDVSLTVAGDRLVLEYRIAAAPSALRLPTPRAPARRDGLWRHTCCELFVAPAGGAAYREFNFSPSGEWAAYAFNRPREGMTPLELVATPVIVTTTAADAVTLCVALARADIAPADAASPLRLGITAVIEDAMGNLSYWALAHPGPQPDFHDPAGFTLTLPAA